MKILSDESLNEIVAGLIVPKRGCGSRGVFVWAHGYDPSNGKIALNQRRANGGCNGGATAAVADLPAKSLTL